MRACPASHVSLQYQWGAWPCPRCKRKKLAVDWRAMDAIPSCTGLHSNDIVVCRDCGLYVYGNQLARMHVLRRTQEVCPRCCGIGHVHRRGRARTGDPAEQPTPTRRKKRRQTHGPIETQPPGTEPEVVGQEQAGAQAREEPQAGPRPQEAARKGRRRAPTVPPPLLADT